MRRLIALTCLVLTAWTAPAIQAQSPAVVPVRLADEGFHGGLFRSGRVYLAGQPDSPAALERLAEAGVKTVINLRTPEEIGDPDRTPFNEAAVSDRLGIRYVNLPAGGDFPYSTAQVDE